MSFVVIQVLPVGVDFEVTLIQENQPLKSALLPRENLTTGIWTALIPEGQQGIPATDIVQRIMNVEPTQRNHADFGVIGETLYNWLLPAGPIRERWLRLQAGTALRIDIRDETLARLPWELVRSPESLRLAVTNELHRTYPKKPRAVRDPSWPFRILIVIGCSAAEESALGIDREVNQIEREFLRLGRSVDVHSLRRPEFTTLSGWIREYHPDVFHFAGHGAKVPGKDEWGVLIEPEAPAAPWIWSSESIPTDLELLEWTPTFVFLNACRSAVDRAAAWSIQRGFLSSGARAVLAMQADIRGDLAGLFAAQVYKKCAEGNTVQRGVTEGRMIVRGPAGGWNHIDWALPALVSTEPDLKLFSPRDYPRDVHFATCKEFEEARFFANCREARRIFLHWHRPCVPGTLQNVLLLTGPPRSGKSHLLKWCMESWALTGSGIRYIEIYGDGGSGKNFLDILRQIRDGELDGQLSTRYLHGGLPPTFFRRFNWELNNRIKTGQPGEWISDDHPEEVEISDNGDPPKASGEQRLEKPVCEDFLLALQEVAKNRPLILVFDRFSGPNSERLLPKEDFNQLVTHFFLPIAEDPISRIRLVFCMNQPERAEYEIGPLIGAYARSYELPVAYSVEDLAELATEMLWSEDAPLKEIRQIATLLLGLPEGYPQHNGIARLKPLLKMLIEQHSPCLDRIVRMR
jgi:hypothetical protein